MTKREYQSLLRKAAVAYNLGSSGYETIMDKATVEVDDWDKFCADLDEAIKVPPTDRQRALHERKEKQKEIESAKRMMRAAKQRLDEALRNQ